MAKENWPDWTVYVRDRCVCRYCGLDGRQDIRVWRQLEIDHLIPKRAGELDSAVNKVVSCHRCNTLKGGKNPVRALGNRRAQPARLLRSKRSRDQLVAIAKSLVDKASRQADEPRDYRRMLREIARRGR